MSISAARLALAASMLCAIRIGGKDLSKSEWLTCIERIVGDKFLHGRCIIRETLL